MFVTNFSIYGEAIALYESFQLLLKDHTNLISFLIIIAVSQVEEPLYHKFLLQTTKLFASLKLFLIITKLYFVNNTANNYLTSWMEVKLMIMTFNWIAYFTTCN